MHATALVRDLMIADLPVVPALTKTSARSHPYTWILLCCNSALHLPPQDLTTAVGA